MVISSLDRSLAELRDLRMLLLAVGVLVPFVSLLGGYLLAGRLLQPLGEMLSSANRMNGTNLDERISVANPHDEIGRLGRTLNRMLDRVQQSVDEQLQFTADAAHELRTPLVIVRSAVELTLQRPRDSDDYEECLQTVVEETEWLTQVSTQLLLVAREPVAADESQMAPRDLRWLLLELAGDIEPLCEVHEPHLLLQLAASLPVRGDRERLRKDFLNLLHNAIHDTPRGGQNLIRGFASKERVEATVSDTGVGIREKHLPHLFRRLCRVESSRNRSSGGSGLGRAICHAIALNHQGTITANPCVPTGMQVRVTLPVEATHDFVESGEVRMPAEKSAGFVS